MLDRWLLRCREKAGADPSPSPPPPRADLPCCGTRDSRMYPSVPTTPSAPRGYVCTARTRTHGSPTFRPPVHAAGRLAGWLADRKSCSRPFGVTDAPLQPFTILRRGGETLPRDAGLCDNPKRSFPNGPSGARGN